MSFLDKTGLEHLWDHCLNKFVNKSGDTMTGNLTAPFFTIRRSNSDYPTLHFHSSSGTLANSIQSSASNGKLYVVAYPSDASGYHEAYMFPTPSTGLTANKDYSVLTTKVAVAVNQGGTGATTAAAARTNLGLTSIVKVSSWSGGVLKLTSI